MDIMDEDHLSRMDYLHQEMWRKRRRGRRQLTRHDWIKQDNIRRQRWQTKTGVMRPETKKSRKFMRKATHSFIYNLTHPGIRDL